MQFRRRERGAFDGSREAARMATPARSGRRSFFRAVATKSLISLEFWKEIEALGRKLKAFGSPRAQELKFSEGV